MSLVRPTVGMSSLNFCRSWGLVSCSLAAARHPKWGLVSAGRPGSEPHAGGLAPTGQQWNPRERQRQSHGSVVWTPGTPQLPWAGSKGAQAPWHGQPTRLGWYGAAGGAGVCSRTGTLQGALVQTAINLGYFWCKVSFTPK